MIKKIALCIVCSLLFLIFYTNYTKKSDLPWETRIKKNGPSAALAAFKTQVAKEEYKKQHLLMHEFGSALFSALDTNGLTSCDDSFGYGCFHGFFIAATKRGGLQILKKLSPACQKNPARGKLECYHGMGHGIISFLGHNNLAPSLTTCKDAIPKPHDQSCAMGVFMEYNFRTMDQTESGRSTRPLDPANPHAPCDTVDPAYQVSCYLYQANWWYVLYEKVIATIDGRCSEVSDPAARQSCYTGIGYSIAPSNNYQVGPIREACGKIKEKTNRLLCLSGAARGLQFNNE